jgi:hypothetical protein
MGATPNTSPLGRYGVAYGKGIRLCEAPRGKFAGRLRIAAVVWTGPSRAATTTSRRERTPPTPSIATMPPTEAAGRLAAGLGVRPRMTPIGAGNGDVAHRPLAGVALADDT